MNIKKYKKGSRVTINSTPNEGYEFSHITVNGVRYNDSNKSIIINEDTDVKAYFNTKTPPPPPPPVINYYDITYNKVGEGVIAGPSRVRENEEFVISVTPNTNYTFSHYSINGRDRITDVNHRFSVSNNSTITVHFTYNPPQPPPPPTPNRYTINTRTNNNLGTVNPSSITGDENKQVSFTAIPKNSNIGFEGWYEGNTLLSTELTYNTTLTSNKTIEARFVDNTPATPPQPTYTPISITSGEGYRVEGNNIIIDNKCTISSEETHTISIPFTGDFKEIKNLISNGSIEITRQNNMIIIKYICRLLDRVGNIIAELFGMSGNKYNIKITDKKEDPTPEVVDITINKDENVVSYTFNGNTYTNSTTIQVTKGTSYTIIPTAKEGYDSTIIHGEANESKTINLTSVKVASNYWVLTLIKYDATNNREISRETINVPKSNNAAITPIPNNYTYSSYVVKEGNVNKVDDTTYTVNSDSTLQINYTSNTPVDPNDKVLLVVSSVDEDGTVGISPEGEDFVTESPITPSSSLLKDLKGKFKFIEFKGATLFPDWFGSEGGYSTHYYKYFKYKNSNDVGIFRVFAIHNSLVDRIDTLTVEDWDGNEFTLIPVYSPELILNDTNNKLDRDYRYFLPYDLRKDTEQLKTELFGSLDYIKPSDSTFSFRAINEPNPNPKPFLEASWNKAYVNNNVKELGVDVSVIESGQITPSKGRIDYSIPTLGINNYNYGHLFMKITPNREDGNHFTPTLVII